jgi:predicted ATPase
MRLISAKIKNFKSLEDVELNFRDLTIIVGANATGKSSCLEALRCFRIIVQISSPPPSEWLQNFLRNNVNQTLILEIVAKDNDQEINYQVYISKNNEEISFSKELLTIGNTVGNTVVIDIDKNYGLVSDEDGSNPQKYQSKEGSLALKAAGDFGNKPLTAKLSEFIKSWKFYDFEPYVMRGTSKSFRARFENKEEMPTLDSDGEYLENILLYYSRNHSDKFDEVNQQLSDCLGISLEISGNEELRVREIDGQKIKLSGLSDGTLRIIAYYMLLYKDDLPPLIGIEEPERNLHPAILTTIANILKKLSQRTQVIITTHSSQLLDCFDSDEINSNISVLLLSKKDSSGTHVFRLEQLSQVLGPLP